MGQPAWAKDGSFLVFRDLQQLVPEFDEWVASSCLIVCCLVLIKSIDSWRKMLSMPLLLKTTPSQPKSLLHT